jgi:signal transduction histidine kinase
VSQLEGALKRDLTFRFDCEDPLTIDGDAHLLRRAVRNILENAVRHAKTAIDVTLIKREDAIAIEIRDDGPGFSKESQKNFGVRRATRRYRPEDDKASLGLGSVIAKSVAKAHHGDLLVGNHFGPEGNVAGAQVVFRLPIQGGHT